MTTLPTANRCGIGLGSNLGDRLAHLRLARAHLLVCPEFSAARPEDDAFLCASVYETDPVDCPPGSGAFLNTVLELPALPSVPAAAVWRRLQASEALLGRSPGQARHAPRVIDLDLLYLGGLELATPELTLPHPRLRERNFVLAPLAEIRPDLILPGDPRPIVEVWRSSTHPGRVTRLITHW